MLRMFILINIKASLLLRCFGDNEMTIYFFLVIGLASAANIVHIMILVLFYFIALCSSSRDTFDY